MDDSEYEGNFQHVTTPHIKTICDFSIVILYTS